MNGGFGLFEVRVYDMICGDDDGCEVLVSESGRVLAGTV